MSGLLQRLIGQAMSLRAQGASGHASRIRSAVAVHAPVPLVPDDHAAPRTSQHAQMSGAASNETIGVRYRAPPNEVMVREAKVTPGQSPAIDRTTGADPGSQPTTRSTNVARAETAAPVALVARGPAPQFMAPARLLGEVASPRAAPAGIVANVSERRLLIDSPGSNVERPPSEVHVHIGRVEVKAVTEAAAPKKPRAPPTRPTRTLSDYLSRGRA
jgi:hypothetical protein